MYKVASRLKGAERIACTPYHLSGVSPVSSEDDVVTFCRLKNVTVTGCYPIQTRVGERSQLDEDLRQLV